MSKRQVRNCFLDKDFSKVEDFCAEYAYNGCHKRGQHESNCHNAKYNIPNLIESKNYCSAYEICQYLVQNRKHCQSFEFVKLYVDAVYLYQYSYVNIFRL